MSSNVPNLVEQIYQITSQDENLNFLWKSKIKEAIDQNRIRLLARNDSVIAFIIFRVYKNRPLLNLLYLGVRKDHRRQGFMTKLIKQIETEFPHVMLLCSTRETNIPMNNLLRKFGFVKTKERFVGKNKDIKLNAYEKGTERAQIPSTS